MVNPQTGQYWDNLNSAGPRIVHGEAGRLAEVTAACRQAGEVNTGIARIIKIYELSTRPDDGWRVRTFACQALRSQSLTAAGVGGRTPSLCHISDTGRGITAGAGNGLAGPVNIGNPDEVTVLQSAQWIIELRGSPSGIEYVPLSGDDPRFRSPAITLAARPLGWRPEASWRQGLTEELALFAARLEASAGVGAGT